MSIQQTPWMKGVPLSFVRPPLNGDMQADVAVIGGGLMGCTAAYLLARAGKRVILLEKAQIGYGETSRAAGFCTHLTEVALQDVCRRFGRQRAALVRASARQAIDEMEAIVRLEGFACEFRRCGLTLFAVSSAQEKALSRELALLHEFGVAAKQEVKASSSHEVWRPNAGLRSSGHARLHPLKYVRALAESAERYGALIYEQTPVIDFQGADRTLLRTPRGSVRASAVIHAAGQLEMIDAELASRLIRIPTFMISASIPHGILKEGLYRDFEAPDFFLRVERKPSHDAIFLGGIDAQSAAPSAACQRLITYLRGLLPGANFAITHEWTGAIWKTNDGLPYIGRLPKYANHFVGAGFGSEGAVFGTIAALMCADLAVGREHSWATLYTPARFCAPVRQPSASLQWSETTDQQHAATQVNKTTGASVCLQLGCLVQWNAVQRTWDCPSHGCQFSSNGQQVTKITERDIP